MGGPPEGAHDTATISSVSLSVDKLILYLLFFRQLEFAPQYLRPVLDVIAYQMQAALSICIIGPVADRNGKIEVRR